MVNFFKIWFEIERTNREGRSRDRWASNSLVNWLTFTGRGYFSVLLSTDSVCEHRLAPYYLTSCWHFSAFQPVSTGIYWQIWTPSRAAGVLITRMMEATGNERGCTRCRAWSREWQGTVQPGCLVQLFHFSTCLPDIHELSLFLSSSWHLGSSHFTVFIISL